MIMLRKLYFHEFALHLILIASFYDMHNINFEKLLICIFDMMRCITYKSIYT